jgi:hypothetical protein
MEACLRTSPVRADLPLGPVSHIGQAAGTTAVTSILLLDSV